MRTRLYFLTALTLVLIGSCKYEDGPAISLRSKCERITGYWDVELFYIDNADSTSLLTSQTCYGPVGFLYDCDETDITVESTCSFTGSWRLIEDDEKVLLNMNSPPGFTPIGPYGRNAEWTILRLTNKEMWLDVNYASKSYEIHLKKKSNIDCHWCL
jgi:hypothetical protein